MKNLPKTILYNNIHNSTWREISDIAQEIDIPLGTIYDFYHFKTEDIRYDFAIKLIEHWGYKVQYPSLDYLRYLLNRHKNDRSGFWKSLSIKTKIPESSLRHLRLGTLKRLNFTKYLSLANELGQNIVLSKTKGNQHAASDLL